MSPAPCNYGLNQRELFELVKCLEKETKKIASYKKGKKQDIAPPHPADQPSLQRPKASAELLQGANDIPKVIRKLQYILDGEAGELCIDQSSCSEISLLDLESGILQAHLSQAQRAEDSIDRRRQMKYTPF